MDAHAFRPPQWALALAIVAGLTAFVWTLVTQAPSTRTRSDNAFGVRVRELMSREEWGAVVDLSRERLEERTGSMEALYFLATGLERRGFAGDADEARSSWEALAVEGEERLERAWTNQGSGPAVVRDYYLGQAYRALGRSAEAREAFARAEERQARMVQRSPTAEGLYVHANLLGALGREEEALDAWTRAVAGGFRYVSWSRVDPDLLELRDDPRFRPLTRSAAGQFSSVARELYAEGAFEILEAVARKRVELVPADSEAWLFQAFALERLDAPAERLTAVWQGLLELAQGQLEARSEGGGDLYTLAGWGGRPPLEPWFARGWALKGLGRAEEARAQFRALLEGYVLRGSGEPGVIEAAGDYNLACYAALAGETELAVECVEMGALRSGGVTPAWAQVDPDLDAIRDEPAVRAEMERILSVRMGVESGEARGWPRRRRERGPEAERGPELVPDVGEGAGIAPGSLDVEDAGEGGEAEGGP
jgi:tetratricopeptide (TPR) repeat protein